MEIWKPTQYEGYEASNLGAIRSIDRAGSGGRGNWKLRKGMVLSQRFNNAGYMRLNIMVNNVRTTVPVHRMVCWAFHGAPEFDGAQVNHKDGNKANNSADNLEWCTQSENQTHAVDTGLRVMPVGSKSKITKYAYIGTNCAGHEVVLIGKQAIHDAGFVQAGVWRSERLGRKHHGYKFIKVPIEKYLAENKE